MMNSAKKLSSAVGAKSARACDNCIKKRARWYCAADDAFLCQSCDSSVHSANTLARRHERVCLKIASIKSLDAKLQTSVPSWHQGFTRKARTPRQKKQSKFNFSDESIARVQNPLHLVPEIYSEENSHEENEEQLLYRVPIFDPFVAELCNSGEAMNNSNHAESIKQGFGNDQSKALSNDLSPDMKRLHVFLPSEADLAEFAADVESLLGKGLEDELFDMEGLGLMDCDDQKERKNSDSFEIERVKVEEEYITLEHNHDQVGVEIDLGRETFELNFDYDSPIASQEEENKAAQSGDQNLINIVEDSYKAGDDINKVNFLRLDYEGLMTAWDGQKSPWTTGERPEIDFGDCWPDCMGTCGAMHAYGEMVVASGHGGAAMLDGGREARVSRYREKRRTRLFSKKIRYEVRKLNAEKRPRMKGRFVKRTSFVTPAPPLIPFAK
ncbi:zinc finger protein CONSTANS-LIKE 16 [Dorcoceras hygrometricum]|uniref:Zinc finger protein CONSTANS-LIKE 16 n=1 Tax=Dorcoceras hygrometricum TaxID=472368 RepID=A0A2Z7C1V0_9LAMI|nr:zinc finger protein CONSTANS-LIKE 16 [Dorcoceras hygrometricum]